MRTLFQVIAKGSGKWYCDHIFSLKHYVITSIEAAVMKYGRNTDGTFSAGNSGKPKGSRNLRKVAIESLLEGQAGALTQKAI